MKIKNITCHDVYNYGASLQAYALQQYLTELGHEVQIIDYFPDYMDVNYRIRWNKYVIPEVSSLYKIRYIPGIKALYRIKRSVQKMVFILEKNGRRKAFDRFKMQYLNLTSERYRNIEDLCRAKLNADVFIAGSDQIWNPLFNNGRDPSFFLQFGEGRKISYAASFGVSSLSSTDCVNMKRWLSSFCKISVREKTGLKLLEELGIRGSVQVPDPVFLLTKESWRGLASSKFGNEKFVLVYNLGPLMRDIKDCAQQLSQQHGMKIVAVEELANISYADMRITDAGPCEFIELFTKASYVVTNSFHATSFSILFNIPFFSYIKNATSSRITDLLKSCGLEARLNSKDLNTDIDWYEVNAKVAAFKGIGIRFLDSI